MIQRVFIDTNILIYFFTKDANKFSLAENILSKPEFHHVISTQILSEFLSVILRKHTSDINQAKTYLKKITSVFEVADFDITDIESALDIKESYKLSYYDSLIVTNALKSNCSILYTEDLHHNLKINKTLKVINPFK